MVLKSYLFIKDEDRTLENRERKRKAFLLGILLFLIGAVFLVIEFEWLAALFVITGAIMISAGQLILAYTPDKGSSPGDFVIETDQIIILKHSYNINELDDLSFNLVNYEGGPSYNRFKNAEGTENEVTFRLNGKLLTMNFYIPTIKHYTDLIKFLEEKDIPFSANRGFPWT